MIEAKSFLYRGTNSTKSVAFKGHPRQTRSPKDSSKRTQLLADLVFACAGIHAQRGNSIFCSASRQQAAAYGDIYYIFPVNDAFFAWTKFSDAYGVIAQQMLITFKSDYMIEFLDRPATQKAIATWFSTLTDQQITRMGPLELKGKHVYDCMKSYLNRNPPDYSIVLPPPYNESMLDVINKAGIPVPKEFLTPEKDFRKSPAQIVDYLDLKDTDFTGALKSKHEIIINGEYFALKESAWASYLANKFNWNSNDTR
jgi:hypothetical protein